MWTGGPAVLAGFCAAELPAGVTASCAQTNRGTCSIVRRGKSLPATEDRIDISKRIRNLSFLLMVVACIFANRAGLLASGSAMPLFDAFHSGCSFSDSGNWSWSGSCDFSEDEDPLNAAADYCDQAWYACQDDCYSSSYATWLATALCDSNDPRSCVDSCWIGWDSFTCAPIGSTASFSCTCQKFNWCPQ